MTDLEYWVEVLGGLDRVLVQRSAPGDGTPELAWGDVFAYYAPDGVIPSAQPFATVVTKDYPGESVAGLDRPGAFRVNVAAGAESFERWAGAPPRRAAPPVDPTVVDEVMVHPTYGSAGWLAVVEPGESTTAALRELLSEAHRLAAARWQRRDEV